MTDTAITRLSLDLEDSLLQRLKDNDAELVELEIVNKTLAIEDIKSLEAALLSNTTLQKLKISATQLDGEFGDLIVENVLRRVESNKVPEECYSFAELRIAFNGALKRRSAAHDQAAQELKEKSQQALEKLAAVVESIQEKKQQKEAESAPVEEVAEATEVEPTEPVAEEAEKANDEPAVVAEEVAAEEPVAEAAAAEEEKEVAAEEPVVEAAAEPVAEEPVAAN